MKTITLQRLTEILDNLSAGYSASFTAIAGPDYGHVRAYDLGDEFLIVFGNSWETCYALSDSDEDLSSYLLQDNLNLEDSILQAANTTGEIPSASSADEGKVRVMVTYHYDWDTSDWAGEFDDYQDAKDWINVQHEGQYVLQNNESGRPTYTIVSV